MIARNSTVGHGWLTVLSVFCWCAPSDSAARKAPSMPVRRMPSHKHASKHEILLIVTNLACSQRVEPPVTNITGGINMFGDRTTVRGGTIPAHRGHKRVRFLAMTCFPCLLIPSRKRPSRLSRFDVTATCCQAGCLAGCQGTQRYQVCRFWGDCVFGANQEVTQGLLCQSQWQESFPSL